MPVPSVDAIVAALDQKLPSAVDEGWNRLRIEHGPAVFIPNLVSAFPRIRNAAGRNAILFRLIRFARTHPVVVELAITALRDPAYMPRMQACSNLAYSLRRDTVPHLRSLLTHRDQKTRDNAAAAIDAIRHQNHHYYMDRNHTGRSFWVVNPEDDPRGFTRPT